MPTRRDFFRGVGAALGVAGAGTVQPTRTARAATTLSAQLRLVRYPYVQNVADDRATILWATRGAGVATADYFTRQTFPERVIASTREFLPSETGLSAPFYQHQVELNGLLSNTEYFYRVALNGQNLAPRDRLLRFSTAGRGPFSFLVFGDSGMGTSAQYQLAQLKVRDHPALVLHTGDIGYWTGAYADYQERYFDYYRNLMKRVPFFPTPGNHDYLTANASPYLSVHAVPGDGVPEDERGRYYSFDWGNAHFISLDTNLSLTRAVEGKGAMLDWLEKDLNRTRQYWRVVFFHHPPFACGPNEDDPISTMVEKRIVPILERHGVELVFNGHEHSYQRSKCLRNGALAELGTGTTYVTSGGGGASLYPVTGAKRSSVAYGESAHHFLRVVVEVSRLTARAIRADEAEIDVFTVEPPPRIFGTASFQNNSFMPQLSPRALFSIWGRNLADQEMDAPSLPLPTTLSGTVVTLNGRRLPLLYVSPTEIDVQVVTDVRGPAVLGVRTENGLAEIAVEVSA